MQFPCKLQNNCRIFTWNNDLPLHRTHHNQSKFPNRFPNTFLEIQVNPRKLSSFFFVEFQWFKKLTETVVNPKHLAFRIAKAPDNQGLSSSYFPFLILRISEYIAKAWRSCETHPASTAIRKSLLSPAIGVKKSAANTSASTMARINKNLHRFNLSIQIPLCWIPNILSTNIHLFARMTLEQTTITHPAMGRSSWSGWTTDLWDKLL